MLAAIATWVIPAGVYNLNAATGEPIPETYHEVASHPARILVDSLTAPINGLYGIEDAKGNINYYNSGSLFGAIDIALFILVILVAGTVYTVARFGSAPLLSASTRSPVILPNIRKTFRTGLSIPLVARSRKPSKYG